MKEEYLLVTRLGMEALISEREGMLAENIHRQACGHSIAYGDEAFLKLKDKFEGLIKNLRDVGA